jgi:hypothetical protein
MVSNVTYLPVGPSQLYKTENSKSKVEKIIMKNIIFLHLHLKSHFSDMGLPFSLSFN